MKIRANTSYYCDLCQQKICEDTIFLARSKFYKIKGYNMDGTRDRSRSYDICRKCMERLIFAVRNEIKNKESEE